MTNTKITQGPNKGFTLIELSIVLVIIGLIVGGVLVGQDLIKAAEIRATVSQKEKFDTAANTFRGKYNGIPGDLLGTTFGLYSTGATGASGLADGDGLIESGSCSNLYGYGGENANFWVHLTEAGMIDGSVSTGINYTTVAAIAAGGFTDALLPGAKIGRGARWMVTSTGGLNYYMLSNPSSTTITTCAMVGTDVISPLNAYAIDTKLDDGLAATGQVISIDATAYVPTAAAGGSAAPDSAGTDDCYDSDTGVYAMTTATLGSQGACSLRIRTSF